ncbi:MAG: ribonucleoside-diphosphate reductase subunit alpha [Candidatus Harrisonbacteria bacterium]|nr:ribonucleoside-diphosphate reductase subunit alpha [Candidatus Harrisonbacteria bacterium]
MVKNSIEKIKKRSGRLVPFDRIRIERAMEKAFISTEVDYEISLLISLADEIIETLEACFIDRIPSVEDVQDEVERKLLKKGFLMVAKHYIIYRREHEKLREKKQKEILKKIERSDLTVKKRSGEFVNFDITQIEELVSNCASGFPDGIIDVAGILEDAKKNIFDGISTREINQAILLGVKNRLELDPEYSSYAARLLFNDLYKDVLGVNEFSPDFQKKHQQYFPNQIVEGVNSGRLDTRLLDFDLSRLSKALSAENDRFFGYLGAQVIYDRYLVRDESDKLYETPQYFFMRVAMGIAINEEKKDERAIEFYKLISSFLYMPSTPTLLHAGTIKPQMSSCYLTTVEDELSHIFKCIGDNAQLSKFSGGVANDWSNIRATGSLIRSINVESQGVIPFLKITDSTTSAINRSGKRRGATCVYLETWHYDIEEFLDLRRNTGDERRRTHDTNTANWIPDLFMQRVATDGYWTLFSPEEVPELHHIYGQAFREKYEAYEKAAEEGKMQLTKKLKARDLWRKMITMIFETGHPWVTFKDPCNIRSPQDHVGVVHSSNLCTEITLNTSASETAVCNLGSISIPSHIENGRLDKVALERTIRVAMRMLDNIIDHNFYPTIEAKFSNLRHRPVGLGIMGFQDALFELGLQFDSVEAVEFSDELMEFVAYHAYLGSSELAAERGSYSTFKGSKWDRGILPLDSLGLLEKERGELIEVDHKTRLDWNKLRSLIKEQGMRNSNCLAIAPTATISNISGCLPSIEPIYKNLYVKSNFSGEFTIVNKYLILDLKKLGIWTKDILDKIKYFDGSIQKIEEIPLNIRLRYKEAFEIDPYWVIAHAAFRGKWIDQSQSVNIFTTSQSGKFIADIYLNAWRMGLKTTYYLRTLAVSGIEKSTIDINKNYEKKEIIDQAVAPIVETIASLSSVPVSAPVMMEAASSTVASISESISPSPVLKTGIHIFEAGLCESCQ